MLRRIFEPCKDDQTVEWRKRHNQELQDLFQRPNITKEASVRILKLVGHAWRKQGSIIRTIIKNHPAGKRPLGRPRLRLGSHGRVLVSRAYLDIRVSCTSFTWARDNGRTRASFAETTQDSIFARGRA